MKLKKFIQHVKSVYPLPVLFNGQSITEYEKLAKFENCFVIVKDVNVIGGCFNFNFDLWRY